MKRSPTTTPPVLQIRPRHPGELVKANQLIELDGASSLSLAARRTFNILLQNAHGPRLAQPGETFEIDLAELRTDHESNDAIGRSVRDLMRIVVIVKGDPKWDSEGTGYTHLLGDCDISSPNRPYGKMRYSFPPKLAALMESTEQYTRLQTVVMRNFTSKYALVLYEIIAKRVNLTKDYENFTLTEFRSLMSVPEGKLLDWSNLRKVCIVPAIREVSQLAEFGVNITPNKERGRTVGVRVIWYEKDYLAQAEAIREIERHSAGRKARRDGTTTLILD
jgi:hypothetical protein